MLLNCLRFTVHYPGYLHSLPAQSDQASWYLFASLQMVTIPVKTGNAAGRMHQVQLIAGGERRVLTMEYAKAWLAERLDQNEAGQTATEYVLVIFGVVLFLVVAAFALNGVLGSAVNAIKSWVTSLNPPPP
jgi:hypothetical protein